LNGRSALDAAELFNTGINFMRETQNQVFACITSTKRWWSTQCNSDLASVWLWIRDQKRSGVAEVTERMFNVAKGAALMAGVE
jgi:aminobenzoyl-glutamate utilization protein B